MLAVLTFLRVACGGDSARHPRLVPAAGRALELEPCRSTAPDAVLETAQATARADLGAALPRRHGSR